MTLLTVWKETDPTSPVLETTDEDEIRAALAELGARFSRWDVHEIASDAALDEEGQNLIDALLVRAKTDGKTVLMASHDLERSARFADRVLDVRGGTLEVAP